MDTKSNLELEAELLRQEHRLFFIIRNFLNRRTFPATDPRHTAVRDALLWRISIALVPATATIAVSATALVALLLSWQANRIVFAQNELILQQNELIESSRRAATIFELSHILDSIDKELKKPNNAATETNSFSPLLIGRIVAMSRSVRPYRYLEENGKLGARVLSPERGQLLITLHASGVDLRPLVSSGVEFSRADLPGARLVGLDVSPASGFGLDLAPDSARGLDMYRFDTANRARFLYSNLQGADFHGANLRGALFHGADLRACDFTDADLRGAIFNAADLTGSYLDNSKLSGSQFLGANLRDTRWKKVEVGEHPPQFDLANIDGVVADDTITNLMAKHEAVEMKDNGLWKRWRDSRSIDLIPPELGGPMSIPAQRLSPESK